MSSLQLNDESLGATSAGSELKLLVKGFSRQEKQMLEAIVKLSQRRQPRIRLVGMADEEAADVVMVDVADELAMAWADRQVWLKRRAVIWVDAVDDGNGLAVYRPIQWPILPMLLVRALERASQKSGSPRIAASGCSSVLVVDDSIAVRGQLRVLLEKRGLEVSEADSAEAALAVCANQNFCCILLDVLMPGMDGYEACRQIKAARENQPVVMLTSRTSPFDRIRGKMAGCDAYLTKPVDAAQLHEVVSRFIAAPAAGGEGRQVLPQLQFI